MVIDANKFLDKNEENEKEFANGMNFAEQKISDFYFAAQECPKVEEQVRLQIQTSLEVIENNIPFDSREENTHPAYFAGIEAVFNLWLEEHKN